MICPHCGHEFPVIAKRERHLLTQAEMNTVEVFLSGVTRNKLIAEKLGTTEQVIKNRFQEIKRKLGVQSRIDLLRFTTSELEGMHAAR